MTKKDNSDAALIAYLTHEVESARKEQIAFGETAGKDVESALQIEKARRRRARGNVHAGWCAAFVQWGIAHVVQRAHIVEGRS